MMLSVLSASADVWIDDFEREEIGEDWAPTAWCANDAKPDWKIEDGILGGRWPHWDAQMLFLAKEYPSLNYTIQVKCRIDKVWQSPDLAGAGFIFRAPTSETNGGCINLFYNWGIGTISSGFMIFSGVWQLVGVVMRNHNLDQWYIIKLVVNDSDFYGYIDDKPICKLKDSKYKGKFVGLWLGSNIDASFDDFMISDSVDEDALENFAISPQDKLPQTWGTLKAK